MIKMIWKTVIIITSCFDLLSCGALFIPDHGNVLRVIGLHNIPNENISSCWSKAVITIKIIQPKKENLSLEIKQMKIEILLIRTGI